MKIRIVEVGPRDGLQNETKPLTVAQRAEFVLRLNAAGLRNIEVGSFVSPKWVPQMAHSGEVLRSCLRRRPEARLITLVPNLQGYGQAVLAGAKEIAIFASATETFSQKNLNCSIAESFARFEKIKPLAIASSIRMRGYLSMSFGCPYEGEVHPNQVVKLTRKLLELGVYEVSIGDTLGVANPKQVHDLIGRLAKITSLNKIALHFHDTRGGALANLLAGLQKGVRSFDSSIGGLGGCPYAAHARGNVATEDVVFMLESMGHKTGIDLKKLIRVNHWLEKEFGLQLHSRVARAPLWTGKGRSRVKL